MKKTLLTLTLVAATAAAFAQGKVSFGNDSQHYFVLGTVSSADVGLGGGVASTSGNTVSGAPGAIPVSPLPSGATLVAALYGGTTAGNMTLQKSVTLDATGWLQAGRMVPQNVVLTGIPGAAPAFFQIYVYNGAYATPQAAEAAGAYFGTSGQFTTSPGGSLSYPGLVSGGPANSTWTANNLVVSTIPEPSTFALAGLGAAAMLIFRRRK